MVRLLIAEGKATQEAGIVSINADQIGIDKILGSGKVTVKMNITARSFSAQAKNKIESMGGQALVI